MLERVRWVSDNLTVSMCIAKGQPLVGYRIYLLSLSNPSSTFSINLAFRYQTVQAQLIV